MKSLLTSQLLTKIEDRTEKLVKYKIKMFVLTNLSVIIGVLASSLKIHTTSNSEDHTENLVKYQMFGS